MSKTLPNAMGADDDEALVVTCFMDMVDWECELGLASGGNRLYPDVEDLKKYNECWQGCGIVEVQVRFVRVVQPPNPSWDDEDAVVPLSRDGRG